MTQTPQLLHNSLAQAGELKITTIYDEVYDTQRAVQPHYHKGMTSGVQNLKDWPGQIRTR